MLTNEEKAIAKAKKYRKIHGLVMSTLQAIVEDPPRREEILKRLDELCQKFPSRY